MAPPAGIEPATHLDAKTIIRNSIQAYGNKQYSYSYNLSEILSFGLWMRKQGFRESSCRSAVQVLKTINKHCDITSTEETKQYLANATFSEGRKQRIAYDLARFYKYKYIPFDKPRYRRIDKLPFVPMEHEIDAIISACGKKSSTLLQVLKETGMRVGEAWNSKWTDIDYERSTITVQPEKHSKSRMLKISPRLIAMLNTLPKNSEYVFHNADKDAITSLLHARRNFERQRKRIAQKLQNPRLMQIHFHTLRHYYACQEYHKTKDILHVMRQLGHHNVLHTMRYTSMIDFPNDEYSVEVAKTVEHAKQLLENGWDYVTKIGENALFRKRK